MAEETKQEKQPESTMPVKKKKISKMTLAEVEEALKKAVQDMGGSSSKYIAHLNNRKKELES